MSELSMRWFEIAADVSLKVLLLAAATALALRALRVRNSNVRHAAWLGVLLAMFALPLMSPVLPTIPVPLPFRVESYLPQTESPPIPVAAADPPALKSPQDATPLEIPAATEPFSFAGPFDADERAAGPMRIDTTLPSEPIEVASEPVLPIEPPAATVAQAAAAGRSLWPEMIVAAWGLGVLALAARLLFAVLVTWRMVRRARPIVEASALIGHGERVALRESPDIVVPMTTGALRPTILLPSDWKTWPAEKLAHVLVHEQTHVKRRDCWTAMLVELAACVYWFHPLVWWLRRRLAVLAEECCDDAAIAASGNRTGYARHLLEIATVLCGQRSRFVYSGFSMARRSSVETRIHAILDFNRPLSRRLTWSATLVLVAVIVPLIAVAAALRPAEFQTETPFQPAAAAENRHSADETVSIELTQIDAASDRQTLTDPVTETTPSLQDEPALAVTNQSTDLRFHGLITNEAGQAVAGAFVGVVATRITNDRGHVPEALAEGVADEKGEYDLALRGVAAKDFAEAKLVVRTEGKALAWQAVDLTQSESRFDVTLRPEQLIQVRLIDIQGQPAAGVSVEYLGIISSKGKGDAQYGLGLFGLKQSPRAIPPTATTDKTGLLTIPHVPADHGVYLMVQASEKFAPQQISLNTGLPERRTETDGSFRPLVRNLKPGEVATIALAPAQIFEGTVWLGDSGKPAANARIDIWSSQQEPFGSMMSLEGKTDEQGRFRLNPYPGVRFGINAYPPAGSPYQIRKLNDLKWETGDSVRRIEIRLPLGVLATGTVIDAETGQPLAGASVQYHPNQVKNKNLSPDLVTGWQSIRQTDEHGKFEIPVAPGPGMLLVHAPAGTSYVLDVKGDQEIQRGEPGGTRYYAHAFQSIDPAAAEDGKQETMPPLTIKLQPGGTVTAKLVDASGQLVQEAMWTSRLLILPHQPFWRAYSEEAKNGVAVFRGLRPGEKYPVFVVDMKRQLGATAEVSLEDPRPTIVLQPCATAKARYLDTNGKPAKEGLMFGLSMVATPGEHRYTVDPEKRAKFLADEDFSVNFARPLQKAGVDGNGFEHYRLLIPGATYRFLNLSSPDPKAEKEFIAESGKEHDLGDIVVNLGEEKP